MKLPSLPTRTATVLAAFLWAVPATLPADDGDTGNALAGQALYLRRCSACHGASGAGDGPIHDGFAAPPRDLRSGFLDRYATPELVDRLLVGSRLAIEFDPDATRRRHGETEAIASYLESLPTADWDRVDRGWDLWLQRCEGCHGAYGAPPPHLPSGVGLVRDLGSAAFQASVSDTELRTAVRHGRKGMPALIPQVEPGESLDLVRFVRHLSPGFAVYQQSCVQCHGERGRGVGSFAESLALPTTVFDEEYFQRIDRDDLRVKIWHMLDERRPRMPHFGEQLSREEAQAIVVYLQSRRALPAAAPP